MSMQAQEGDPGKLAWFKDARWTTNHPLPVEPGGLRIDPRVCPGCLFPYSMRPTPHVNDARCKLFLGNSPQEAPKNAESTESASCGELLELSGTTCPRNCEIPANVGKSHIRIDSTEVLGVIE